MKYKENEIIPEMEIGNDYFSVQSLKTAVWQYLVDHCGTESVGFSIRFRIPSEEEFWRRVKAREDGRFKRNDLFAYQRRLKERNKYADDAIRQKRKYDKRYKILSHLNSNGNFTEKFLTKTIFFLRKISNGISTYLVENHEQLHGTQE